MRLLLAALLGLILAPPAHAEWHRIETAEFALQADMEPEALRALGVQLLDHDRLLREVLEVTGPGRGRRIEMIIYGDHAQLVAESGMPALAAGFFTANPIENFALLPARDTADYSTYDMVRTLRHEYTHYFMVRHLGRQYPGWFIEGLASFFETAHRGADGIMRYGAPHEDASIFLLEFGGLPFSKLGAMPDFRAGDEQIGRFYAQGWLITSHYFMGGLQAPGIKAYLDTARRNGKPDANLFAGGPGQLDRDVAAWFAAGLPPEKQVNVAPADPSAIALRPLSAGEIGLIGLRLEIYRRGSQITQHRDATEATAALSRQALQLASANPGDRAVGRYAAKLFLLMDSDEVGSDDIAALLDPAGTTSEDRILQARLMTRRADEGPPAKFQQTIAASRATLQEVLKADPDNVDALVAMFENVREAEGASSQAAQYLAKALAIEPANGPWRMTLLELYLRDNRKADIVALLQPIANMPHGGGDAAMASDMIKRFAGIGPAQ
ncbi:lipopolysaccharide assembly protein LapB [Sphingopyxis sp. KK2]|uniref:tetratricopeptide repeat protein n=1 Tax=Sphingopyxis sp. KK2 TaxID=1855727 RepID=UPI00118188C6|nr:hypothetical protein [Sphingopyxis sp. KK2]